MVAVNKWRRALAVSLLELKKANSWGLCFKNGRRLIMASQILLIFKGECHGMLCGLPNWRITKPAL